LRGLQEVMTRLARGATVDHPSVTRALAAFDLFPPAEPIGIEPYPEQAGAQQRGVTDDVSRPAKFVMGELRKKAGCDRRRDKKEGTMELRVRHHGKICMSA
jgi:hypothetical protein